MKAKLGRITAHLADPVIDIPGELTELINRNIGPPTPVTPSDVYIRTMHVVSDEVNSLGGRFPVDEHQRLTELLIDSPVLIGHRKDKLPLARTFHAVVEETGGRRWIKTYFYWLRTASGADNLARNIDGGIFKECSIGFTFCFAECSICGRDIRQCRHEPFRAYTVNGESQDCHFNYRKIDRVLETSLVYRGATPDTRVGRELAADQLISGNDDSTDSELIVVTNLNELPECDGYLVMPHYDALQGVLRCNGSSLSCPLAERFDRDISEFLSATTPLTELDHIPVRFVGFRGKERCSSRHTARHLAGLRTPVSRVVMFLVPSLDYHATRLGILANGETSRVIPHRIACKSDLQNAVLEITSRSGVEIWCMDSGHKASDGYHFNPHQAAQQKGPASASSYQLVMPRDTAHGQLTLNHDGQSMSFLIRQFHAGRLAQGARFLADVSEPTASRGSGRRRWHGGIDEIQQNGDGWRLRLIGDLTGGYALRPVRIEGRSRLLFYRLPDNASEGQADV